jgi:serine/threonine protein kinase/tetratricopeptide (TPR) repeat protein
MTHRGAKPIVELPRSTGTMNPAELQQELLDQLAEEFAERCRKGERPSIQEYIDRYPQAAESLREILPSVALLEQLKPGRRNVDRESSSQKKLERLGEYRIVREVGRGGMGIVYEAIQESLGRRVALKLLPKHSLLDPKRLERFRIEAQAAAQLHHSNIVPVFGLFESDGLHYYVMQFIDGRGLDALLIQLKGAEACRETIIVGRSTAKPTPEEPIQISTEDARPAATPAQPPKVPLAKLQGRSYWQQVARIGQQVAEALHDAHQQGTLHRDIKPANLLLDHQGTVWITDFGLAKLREQDGLTSTGDVVGTLQYIAPETLHGQFGPQSDVYSLGLTLCELLTLEPPFPESNPARLLKLVSEQEPVRPRKRNPAIPRDLETIVLKAIAREPSHRYSTAQALADDLGRFLEDRPIQARRTTSVEHFWRWCRRNPALAGSVAAALVSLMLAAIVGWWAYGSTTRALASEAAKRTEAEQATQRAEANMNLSLTALEEIFAAIAPPQQPERGRGSDRPGGGRDRQAPPPRGEEDPFGPPGPRPGPGPGPGLAGPPPRDPLGLGPPRGDRPPPEDPQGLGKPPGKPGDKPDEEQKHIALLQTVLAFYERFAKQNDTNPHLRFEAARAERHVADIHRRLGQTEDALSASRRSAEMLEALASEFPDNQEYLRALVDIYLDQFSLLESKEPSPPGEKGTAAQPSTAADEALRQAQRVAGLLASRFPADSELVLRLGRIDRQLGLHFESLGEASKAESAYRNSIVTLREAKLSDHDERCRSDELMLDYDYLVTLLLASQKKVEATAALKEAAELLSQGRKNRQRDQRVADLYERLAEINGETDEGRAFQDKADQLRDDNPPDARHDDDAPPDRPRRRPPPPPPPPRG